MGLVFTKKVALAIVVFWTAKMNVTKWRLSTAPETTTSSRSRFASDLRLWLITAKKSMATAAMNSLKKVREIADASVANRMRIALEPKKKDATNRITDPFGAGILERILDQSYSASGSQSFTS
jgi:hypothetical protein